MSGYITSLTQLQTAIVENKPEAAIELLGRKTPSLSARLNAYIQGYRIRLCNAVENDYPALKHYLGAAQLSTYARAYVEQTPSHSYTIDQYPLGFADYMIAHSADAHAQNLAMLESTIAKVFWLEDSAPLIPATDFSMEQLMALTLELRSASTLLNLTTDADAYLAAFRSGTTHKPEARQTYLLVVRHENEVKRHALTEAEYAVLMAVNGQPFATALEEVMLHNAAYHQEITSALGNWLGRWIRHGFFKASCT